MTAWNPSWADGAAPAPTDLASALTLLSGPPTRRSAGLTFTVTGPAEVSPSDEPVLLVHGIGADRRCWAPVLPALAAHHPVLIVDLPGHGGSAPLAQDADATAGGLARTVAAALRELGAPTPHVVGNSLGGWVGLELAADDAAASLTALAPAGLRVVPHRPPLVLTVNRLLARATAPLRSVLVDPLLGSPTLRGLLLATGSQAPSAVPADLARAIVDSVQHCSGYEQVLTALSRNRFERAGDIDIDLPVTVVWGDHDRILTAVHQSRQLVPPQTRWVVLPRCGHAPMWDAPEAVVQLVGQTAATARARSGTI